MLKRISKVYANTKTSCLLGDSSLRQTSAEQYM